MMKTDQKIGGVLLMGILFSSMFEDDIVPALCFILVFFAAGMAFLLLGDAMRRAK